MRIKFGNITHLPKEFLNESRDSLGNLKFNRFSKVILRNSYWKKLQNENGSPILTSDSEVMFAVLMSIVMTGEASEDMTKERSYLQTFGCGLNIDAERQRWIHRMIRIAHDSGWRAIDMIATDDECEDFVDAYIDICLIDKRVQTAEFRLLHQICKRLDVSTTVVSKQMRKRLSSIRYRLVIFFDRPLVSTIITILIVFNSIMLGLMTSESFRANCGRWFYLLDFVFMMIFSIEIICRIFAFRKDYFKEPQNIFDFCVIAVSWIPAPAFRWFSAFRVLRAMLLINRLKQLKLIMRSLMDALPNIGWVSILLFIYFYVFAVITTRVFGTDFDMFSTIPQSFFSLFQLMTLEGWPDLVRTVMAKYPYAWLLFIPFMLITSYVFLNLVIGIIVTAMQDISLKKNAAVKKEIDEIRDLREDVTLLSEQVFELKKMLNKSSQKDKDAEDTEKCSRCKEQP